MFRKKVFTSVEELQEEFDQSMDCYNRERIHSGRYCYGKTLWETFQSSKYLALNKQLHQLPFRAAEASSI